MPQGYKFMNGAGFDDYGNPIAAPAPPTLNMQPRIITPAVPTAANGFGTGVTDPYVSEYDKIAQQRYQESQTPIDTNRIRKQKIAQFQAEIDATNQIYSNLIAKAGVEGQGRIGQSRAIAARSGLINQPRGDAQKEQVITYNQGIEGDIRARQQAAISSIMTEAQNRADAEIAKREEAKRLGADQYLQYLAGTEERKATNAKSVLQSLLTQGLSLEDIPADQFIQIANSLRMTPQELTSVYKGELAKAQAAQEKADAEIAKLNAEAAKAGQTILNEGDILVDAEGNVIARGNNKPITLPEGSVILNADGTVKYKNPKTVDPLDAEKKQLEINKLKKDISGRGDLTPSQQNAAFKLVDDYEKASGDIGKVTANYNRVVASAKNPTAAGDLSLIFSYMKTLDPTSVVREGEFATAATAGSIPDRIWGQYNKIINGERLSDNQRQDFVSRARELYNSALEQQKVVDETFTQRAQQFGIDPSYVVRNQSSFNSQPSTSSSSVNGPINPNNPLVKQLKQQIPGITDDEIRQALGFNSVGSDTNKATAFVRTGIAPVIANKYPDGSTGPGSGNYEGQCAVFAEALVNLPTPGKTLGDSKSAKFAKVDNYGIRAAEWRHQVKVGDVIITGENPTYGHVAVVNAILPSGKIQLSESNFKQSKKVSNDRVISINSPQIYGALRGTLKINPILV